MPPVGNGQPVPQGPPPEVDINGNLTQESTTTSQSVGSKAANVADETWLDSNEVLLKQNTPAPEEQLAPAEETVMSPSPGAVRIPVAPAATTEAASDPLSAFAPKPPAGPYSQAPSALATPTEQADQRVTLPEPDWKTMAKSTKAGVEPTAPSAESPAAATYGELDQTKLDREAAGDPNMEKLYRFASENFKAAASLLEIANGIENPGERKRGLNATIPAVRKSLDTLEKNI